jgi:hypothetical protein
MQARDSEDALIRRWRRPGAFEQYAVEDFNLIKMVALRLKELPSLVNIGPVIE